MAKKFMLQACAIALAIPMSIGVSVDEAAAGSERATTTWPAESNARCSTYAGNKDIREMTVSNNDLIALSDTSDEGGDGSGTTGLDDPSNPDGQLESIHWDVVVDSASGDVTGLTYTTDTLINFVVLTSSAGGEILIYPEQGVITDTVTADPLPDGIGQISKFSACYGLVQDEVTTTGIEYPRCSTSTIDGVGVNCATKTNPETGETEEVVGLVCNIEVDQDDGGVGDGQLCCWCGVDPATVTTCDSPETCVDENGDPLLNEYEVGRGQLIIEWTGKESCGWVISGTKRYWICR
jgi:hypothetical protein